MAISLCVASLVAGYVLLAMGINNKVTVWLRDVPYIGEYIEKVSFPIGTGLFALGLFSLIMGWCN